MTDFVNGFTCIYDKLKNIDSSNLRISYKDIHKYKHTHDIKEQQEEKKEEMSGINREKHNWKISHKENNICKMSPDFYDRLSISFIMALCIRTK